MKLLGLLFVVALVIIGMLYRRNSEMSSLISSKDSHIERQENEIKIETQRLNQKLESYEKFGDADPRHISASYAKVIEDRQALFNLKIECHAKWELKKRMEPDSIYNREIKAIISEDGRWEINGRRIMHLGTRSGSVFFLVALSDDECGAKIQFRPYPGAVRMRPVDCTPLNPLYTEVIEYEQSISGSLYFSVIGSEGEKKWSEETGAVLHAWRQGGMTLLVIGFDDPNAPTTALFPFNSERDLLQSVEAKNQRYPVSSVNGFVGLAPLEFGREYDHRGQCRTWEGTPGSMYIVFSPVEKFDRPVMHSFILQLDPYHAFWTPAYEVQRQLNAVQEQFHLESWVRVQACIGKDSLYPVPLGPNSRRVKLIESFRTLMRNSEGLIGDRR